MFRTALTSAWARKRRLAGTAVAVILGVAFLTATLVIGDTVTTGFSTAFGEANEGTDAVVRSADRMNGSESMSSGSPMDASVVDLVKGADGVRAVAPVIEGAATIVGKDGRPLGADGPPAIGSNWIADPDLTGYELAEGRAPEASGEVVIDKASAENGDLAIGDTATVLTPAPVQAKIVGIATFGGKESLGGVTLAAFTQQQAQELFVGGKAQVTQVVAGAADGVTQEQLVATLSGLLPDSAEAITGTELTAEQEADIQSDFLGFLEKGLLAFAGIALLVAAFSIYNTFSILAAQRTRESAVLRMLGASRTQVLVASVGEAGMIGVLGSFLGIGAGIALAAGLKALMESSGFGMPMDGLVIAVGSVVVAVAVGTIVTLAGGLMPAWRSSRVAPIAALRDAEVESGRSSKWRIGLGVLVAGAGVALVLSGTSGEGSMGFASLGALAVVIGVILLGPVVAVPVGSALGAPLRLRGVSGDLARRNAVRNPRRTSATAAALLVGVAVVSLFTVFAASITASLGDAVDDAFAGDLVMEPAGFSGPGLGPDLLAEVRGLPEVGDAAGMGWGQARMDGDETEVGFGDLASIAAVADFDVKQGDISNVGPGGFAISSETGEKEGWALGDEVKVDFVDGATETLTVGAIYDDDAMGGNVLLPTEVWQSHVPQTGYFVFLLKAADGVSVGDAKAAVLDVADRHGHPTVRDRDEFVDAEAGEVNTLLGVIYGLLAIAIVIAVMGIGNTLSLSIHERTRELGLLRAVGQTRSQMRAMVRWESVIVATFGTVGGVGIGLFVGWGLVRALTASEGFGTYVVPVGQLVVILALGAAVGILAGLRPAWRAARLDVLDAVSAD
jgi:putative ABC transport system permease protein